MTTAKVARNLERHLADVATHIEHRTAISVAGFLAGESSDNVQSIARKLFRAITLERVLKKDMANASPDPELIKMTTPATLGTVDAFLSHSWQDDSDLKWEQLQAWGEEFRRTHGGGGSRWCGSTNTAWIKKTSTRVSCVYPCS